MRRARSSVTSKMISAKKYICIALVYSDIFKQSVGSNPSRTARTQDVCVAQPSSPPDTMDDDPMQWELDQIEKLKRAFIEYDSSTQDAAYKSRLKLIQKQSIMRQRMSVKGLLGTAAGNSAIHTGVAKTAIAIRKRAKVGKWVTVSKSKHGKRFKSFSTAKALLPPPPQGVWKIDKDAPSGQGWRRFVCEGEDAEGNFSYTRARLLLNPGEQCPPPF